nr:lysophospholipid acyltransferase family protein [Paracoccus endophyticus]
MSAPPAPDDAPRVPLRDRVASAAFMALIRLFRLLPYDRRIPAMGWTFAHLVGPVAGWRRRIRENLALARPDLTPAEVRRLTRAVPDNAGRALMEIYSGAEFTARVGAADPLTGPGVPALEQAAAAGRPVILACAHFGNYDAMRAAIAARGWPVGALYRPMNNRAFNRHYIPTIEAIAQPLFPRAGRAGLTGMLRFLRRGGMLCLGFDQFDRHGATLRFFGLPSETVLTPAELALRHGAALVPIAGVRQPDGLSFRVEVGLPIPASDAATMMQALNDDLERLVRAHMDQWFWVHRRWKAPPRRTPAQPAGDDTAAPPGAFMGPAVPGARPARSEADGVGADGAGNGAGGTPA